MRSYKLKITGPVLLTAAAMAIAGCGGGNGNGSGGGGTKVAAATYTQVDRLGRPAVNEVFATVANDRHAINDTDSPTNDVNELANDIQTFMTTTAGRSAAITNVVKAVLVPDVLKADLSPDRSE